MTEPAPTATPVSVVELWRRKELRRLFPLMPLELREELAAAGDPYLLEKARKLHRDGWPHGFAYLVLK